jgi:hypothetical protein
MKRTEEVRIIARFLKSDVRPSGSYDVRIVVDWDRAAAELGGKAARNRTGKAAEAGGIIRAEIFPHSADRRRSSPRSIAADWVLRALGEQLAMPELDGRDMELMPDAKLLEDDATAAVADAYHVLVHGTRRFPKK